jgi:hypothetical protein
MLEDNRRQAGWSVGQATWRLGMRDTEIEAGERWPSRETDDRIAAAFSWPRTIG